MSLYRWFKTQVYWLIPDSFKSNDPNNEFVGTTDLVTIYKVTDENGVYENRNVTLNELAGLIGGGEQGPVGPMGPQGPAGPAVPSGLNWQGEYASETNYAFNDVVTWTNPSTSVLGSYWVTNESGVYNIPPTNGSGVINEGWAFLASQGAQGIQGPAGPTGATGPQGPAASIPTTLMNWAGTHTAVNAYPMGSVVKKSGSGSTAGDYYYYALGPVPAGTSLPTLGTSNAYWQLVGSYGTGVTGISYGGGSAKGNVSINSNSPSFYSGLEWKVGVNNGSTNQIGLTVYKPYIEFGGPIYFNGANSISNSTFMVQNSYVNDVSLTSSNISIAAVPSSPATYLLTVNQFFDNFEPLRNNVISLELNDGVALSSDVFMVKYSYDAYNHPDKIIFKILIFSGGAWIPWTTGTQTPILNVYLKRYNN